MSEKAPGAANGPKIEANKFGVAWEDFKAEVLASEPELLEQAKKFVGTQESLDFTNAIITKALENFRHYDPAAQRKKEQGTQIMAWLYVMMRNAHRQEMGKKQTRKRKESMPGFGEAFVASFPDAHEEVAMKQMAKLLPKYLEQLTPEWRDLINLWSEDLPQEEIAERLGIPVGSVKSGTKRALDRLKRLAKEDQQGE